MCIRCDTDNTAKFITETDKHARIWQLTESFRQSFVYRGDVFYPEGTYVICNENDTPYFFIDYHGAWSYDYDDDPEEDEFDVFDLYIKYKRTLDKQIPEHWGETRGMFLKLQAWGYNINDGDFIEDFLWRMVRDNKDVKPLE